MLTSVEFEVRCMHCGESLEVEQKRGQFHPIIKVESCKCQSDENLLDFIESLRQDKSELHRKIRHMDRAEVTT